MYCRSGDISLTKERSLRTYVYFTLVASIVAALVWALPALAATPTFKGTVGPGFTITLSKKPTKPGKTIFVIADKSSVHNFHLFGPGVNKKTSVSGTGTTTWTVTLQKGTYRFVCDPHKAIMKGSFTIR
jgi:plastocyanin